MIYLFVGEDYSSKDIELEKIKRQFFKKESEIFNYEVLYAPDLELLKFQEELKRLPQQAKKRVILIRQAELLKKPIKDYLLTYIKKPFDSCVLIFDQEQIDKKDSFTQKLIKSAKVIYLYNKELLNTFQLASEIEQRKIKKALLTLHDLIQRGSDPEMILGGLRYRWQNSHLNVWEKKRRLALLLDCDLMIKTGKLKPLMALEKLLFSLVYF